MSSSPSGTPRRSGLRSAGKQTRARTPSPTRKAKTPKAAPKSAPPAKAKSPAKKEPTPPPTKKKAARKIAPVIVQSEDDESVTSESSNSEEGEEDLFLDEMNQQFATFLQETHADSSVLHKVVRIQYLQCYAFGIALLLSSFKVAGGAFFFLPVFEGTSPLVQSLCGAMGIAQAFTLTAVAQTSYTPMKKALQYNMMFHLVFALLFIVHASEKQAQLAQWIVVSSILNLALNMWACYFYESPDANVVAVEEVDESEDEDESEEEK